MNRLSRLACLMEDSTLLSRIKLLFQLQALLLGVLLGAAAADKGPSPSQSYGAPQDTYRPQVKYGGPIVYSGEKPPIIHFPPPPEVSPVLSQKNNPYSLFSAVLFQRRIRREVLGAPRSEVCASASPRAASADLPVGQRSTHPRCAHSTPSQGTFSSKADLCSEQASSGIQPAASTSDEASLQPTKDDQAGLQATKTNKASLQAASSSSNKACLQAPT